MCASGCLFEEKSHITCLLLFQHDHRPERPFTSVCVLLEYPLAQQNKSRSLSLSDKLTVTPPLIGNTELMLCPPDLDYIKKLWSQYRGRDEGVLQCWGIAIWGLRYLLRPLVLPVLLSSPQGHLCWVLFKLCTCLHAKNSSKNNSGESGTTHI